MRVLVPLLQPGTVFVIYMGALCLVLGVVLAVLHTGVSEDTYDPERRV
jgi:hypothetical protein